MFTHEDHTKVTPKDFVLYAGLMISLYWSAVNLGILWFEYIDRLFPDRLDTWVDPFSGAIRFAMASLIIMVPIFLGLSYYINTEIRKHEAKATLWIRRWLLYITLLIAGVVVAGNLIALVNTFLAGEITVRFLLKVVTILIIAGGGLAYYIFDIRDFWQQHKRVAQGIGATVALAVLASIVAGFLIAGSPGEQRALRFDSERVNDLSMLQWQLVDYWQNKGELPENLSALEDSLTGFSVPRDPETQDPYTYGRTNDLTFELCAVFARPSKTTNVQVERFPSIGIKESNWDHGSGEECFVRTIDPDKFPARNEPLPIG